MATRLLPAQALVCEGFFLELPSGFRGGEHASSIVELFQVMKPIEGLEGLVVEELQKEGVSLAAGPVSF